MDINNSANVVNLVSNSISRLNLNNANRAFENAKKELENNKNEAQEVKQEEITPVNEAKIKKMVDVADIQKYANLVGENLSIEDINYGLMYGRSVIADYSA